MKPKFSIIIPVYNVAPYLRACLDSVVAAVGELEKVSGEKRWTKEGRFLAEVICVDDGSTDGSGEILDEYVERVNSSSCEFEREGGVREENGKTSTVHLHLFSPPSFRVIHQKNAGVSAARNAALDVANGDWVVFVDADDLMSPMFLSESARLICCHPNADIVRFETKTFRDGECHKWEWLQSIEKEVDISKSVPHSEVAAALWGAAYRRAILPRTGFKRYCRGEDRLFVGECIINSRLTVRSSSVAYAYRQRPGSAMCSTMNAQKLIDRLGYSRDWGCVLAAGGKSVPRAIFHEIGVNLTEGFLYDLYRIEDRTTRDKMWTLWYSNLGWMNGVKMFPLWTRSVIRFCWFVRIRLLALLLCYVPMWLKKKGLHR